MERCPTCMAVLLELARAGGNPRLWSTYEDYYRTGDEEHVERAVTEAGPDLLKLAKENIAIRGLLTPEEAGVDKGTEVWNFDWQKEGGGR